MPEKCNKKKYITYEKNSLRNEVMLSGQEIRSNHYAI